MPRRGGVLEALTIRYVKAVESPKRVRLYESMDTAGAGTSLAYDPGSHTVRRRPRWPPASGKGPSAGRPPG